MKVPFLDLSRQTARLRPELDAAIARVLDGGQFILGPEVEAFEREFARAAGARAAVGVASGTQALELILRARGIGAGAEVIVPALTSPFTALAVLAAGATPVFADVDPQTLLLDLDSVRRQITERTQAVIPVHLYGRRVPLEPFAALGLEVIQDACQAHGAALSYGHPAAFSFYPTKNLGALGDSGAALTDDEDLARELRRLRHGGQREYAVASGPGINSRLDELQAAVLRAKLPHLPSWNARRRELARRYARVRPPCGGVSESPGDHVFHLYVIRSRPRRALREKLSAAQIGSAVHYPVPLHRQPAFRAPVSLPCAEAACEEILSLPLNPEMTDPEAEAVCSVLSAER